MGLKIGTGENIQRLGYITSTLGNSFEKGPTCKAFAFDSDGTCRLYMANDYSGGGCCGT